MCAPITAFLVSVGAQYGARLTTRLKPDLLRLALAWVPEVMRFAPAPVSLRNSLLPERCRSSVKSWPLLTRKIS